MLQGTDRIRGRTSPDGGTSRNGTHRAPPPLHCASTKQRPFPHRRLCCPPGSTSTTAASDAHPAHHPFPGTTGYRARLSDSTNSAGCRAGEGLPSSRRHYLNVPCPIRRGVPHGCAPGSPPLPWPSPCFRGLGTPCTHPKGGPLTTPQTSLHATDRSVAPPTGAFDTGLRPDPFPSRAASLLPGLLAATRTGLPPASNDELTNQDHLSKVTSSSAGRTKDRARSVMPRSWSSRESTHGAGRITRSDHTVGRKHVVGHVIVGGVASAVLFGQPPELRASIELGILLVAVVSAVAANEQRLDEGVSGELAEGGADATCAVFDLVEITRPVALWSFKPSN